MAGNNPLLDTPRDTEDSTGLRAPAAPTEKLEPGTDREVVQAQVLGLRQAPIIVNVLGHNSVPA